MGTTAKANMIFPPLYAEAVEGAFASQDAFVSAKAKAFGIVRIDGGSGGTDQRNCIGFRLVHFDEFLQRMDQFLAQILRRNGGIGNFA